MFGYTVSLGRIHDKIRVREGAQTLELTVDSDPMKLTSGLLQAQEMLHEIDGEDPEKTRAAALYFAGVIFREEQANKLLDFYLGDASCVINVCGRYFADRLSKKISAAQKKRK